MKAFITIIFAILIISCQKEIKQSKSEIKEEVMQAEKEFEKYLHENGFAEAFYNFADTSAVIHREGTIIKGKELIKDFYSKKNQKGVTLNWTPEFIDVSECGDLAYTYGKYQYTVTDSLGHQNQFEGYFHTVWKKQPTGEWRYVWD